MPGLKSHHYTFFCLVVGTVVATSVHADEPLAPVPDPAFFRESQFPDSRHSIAPELVLTAEELAGASNRASPFDSAIAILRQDASAATNHAVETSLIPRKLVERVPLVGQQLLEDADYYRRKWQEGMLPADGKMSDGTLNGSKVIDSDNRQQITNTQVVPYNAVCSIETTFQSGTCGTGKFTAAFVAPRVLLTTRQAVSGGINRGNAKSIRVAPGKNGSNEPYGAQVTTTYALADNGVDAAWVILPDKTLFNRVGYAFGYKVISDSELATTTLNLAGYHGDKPAFTMWYQGGGGNQVPSTNTFSHTFDTVSASGSPFWQLFKTGSTSNRLIVGVNTDPALCCLCAPNPTQPPPTTNTATRMTQALFNKTQSLAAQYK